MTAGRDALRERLAERLIPFVWSTGDVDAVIREIAPCPDCAHTAAQGYRRKDHP